MPPFLHVSRPQLTFRAIFGKAWRFKIKCWLDLLNRMRDDNKKRITPASFDIFLTFFSSRFVFYFYDLKKKN